MLILPAQEETGALYAIALSATGYDAVVAHGGAEAYRRANELHPDIVVVELPMRNNDAWQFLQDLKETERTKDIPVLAVTGNGPQPTSDGNGGDRFQALVAKPCLPQELPAAIRHRLDGDAHASGTR